MDVIQYQNEESKWDDYVISSDSATGYHQIGWKTVIEQTYGLKSYYLMALEDERIVGILPLFFIKSRAFGISLVSLPFLNYGGICADNHKAAESLLRKAAYLMGELDAQYVELHHLHKYEFALSTNEGKVTLLLRLDSDPDTLWKGFRPKVRNQVRKAARSGLEVRIGGIDYLDDFYDAFAVNMRDLGSPVHSKALFENLLHGFPDSTRIFMVYLESETVGGAIFISFKDIVEVPWASSKREYFQFSPNNLLYWEVIKYACEKGFNYFDFGKSSWNSGTFRFKKQWGAEPKQLYSQYYLSPGALMPEVNHTSLKDRVAIGVWKRLPLRVTKALGPRVRKNISS